MIKVASVIIYRGKAYVPTTAQMEADPYLDIEPVYLADLTVDELTQALERAIAAGNPKIPTPSLEEFQHRKDPILAATGARSWRALARQGRAYTIEWRGDKILLYFSELDGKGRFASGVGRFLEFATDIDIRTIAGNILNDAIESS